MTKSKSKIEQKAITKVRDLIDKIEFFKHDLKDTDKNISWDGTVEMYNGNTDIKENYDYTIDVQVKGRTTNNKKFSSKYRFPLDKIDLENYLKKEQIGYMLGVTNMTIYMFILICINYII